MAWIKKRRTSSGEARYDVGYRDPSNKVRRKTFTRERDAKAFLRTVEADVERGQWIDPRAGAISFQDHATRWFRLKGPTLQARTRELYESELRLHILPVLGSVPLKALSPSVVRDWWFSLSGPDGPGKSTAAKCYRLLRQILAAAVEEELILKNPCNIKGAGKEPHKERDLASIAQVDALMSSVPPERRLLVLLGSFTGLRLAEILALRRRHISPLTAQIHVLESTVELAHGEQLTKGPKSEAGRRIIHLDPWLAEEVQRHLDEHVATEADSYLFVGIKGNQLRRGVWHKEWTAARREHGLLGFTFHDMRHVAGTLFAQGGATPRETMRRLGHSSMDAAMRYQHASEQRDAEGAAALGRLVARDRASRSG